MNPRTGLGLIETALLAAVFDLGGVPGARRRRTDRVLDRLEHEHGIGPRYAYAVLIDLAVPWSLHLPLLDVDGNVGSREGDPPADARYTSVRLSKVGALAVAAERGELGPVPLGIVEGSLYRDGRVPPFAPARVVAALQEGTGDAGPPVLPTGGQVAGDVDALLAGRETRLQLGCTIVREPGALVITGVPLGVRVDLVEQSIANRVRRSGTQRFADYLSEPAPAPERSPVVDVRNDSSMRVGTRIVCRLAADADHDEAETWVRYSWPVTTEVDCRLPGPMATRLCSWDAGDGSGLAALAALLRAATREPRDPA